MFRVLLKDRLDDVCTIFLVAMKVSVHVIYVILPTCWCTFDSGRELTFLSLFRFADTKTQLLQDSSSASSYPASLWVSFSRCSVAWASASCIWYYRRHLRVRIDCDTSMVVRSTKISMWDFFNVTSTYLCPARKLYKLRNDRQSLFGSQRLKLASIVRKALAHHVRF